ncbi:ABC transporter ATP-binding protein [Pseudoglutamicibacter cumminsii]|uniref:ABC transporter ATP-binding protein n=1 Tax=Pseudoglutamicibacter cumminsii TaxID=156979 RepID=UPI0021A46122|nr:ABC transporter ATP-binding protein [Pseudoglutamicibacter cumminsii]MCT1686227.1 ABC transporter ATP-binding protein [Pseudoglutamicibacter cumminsii]
MTTVTVENVHKYLGVGAQRTHVLRGIDLQASAGEFVGLAGKSGSGKTTLLRAIAGLIPVDKGRIDVLGIDVGQASEAQVLDLRRNVVGFVHQDDLLIQELTAAENVMLVLSAAGASQLDAEAMAKESLTRVGLGELFDRYPAELSRGQCQRVGIARALSGERRVLLADEPSAALDTENSHAMFGLFRDLAEAGSTVIATSHDPIMNKYCHTGYALVDGRIEAGEVRGG